MRAVILYAALMFSTATFARAEDLAGCQARQIELARKAEQFNGDQMIKRLILADLRRAQRELAEGDAEECTEALDHAAKLLTGDI